MSTFCQFIIRRLRTVRFWYIIVIKETILFLDKSNLKRQIGPSEGKIIYVARHFPADDTNRHEVSEIIHGASRDFTF